MYTSSVQDNFKDRVNNLHATKLDAIVTGVTVLAMQFVIPHSDIRAIQTVSESHETYATLEAINVIKQA